MTAEHIHIFDRPLQNANIWIKELSTELGWDDQNRTYSVLRGTLHALRDRIPVDEAVHLGAQLPIIIKGVYYDGWKPAATPQKYRHKEEFLAHAAQGMPVLEDAQIEKGVETVIRFLSTKVSPGEIREVVDSLPKDVSQWWHQASAVHH